MRENFFQLLVFFFSFFLGQQVVTYVHKLYSWIGFLQSFIFIEKILDLRGCTDFVAKAWINRY